MQFFWKDHLFGTFGKRKYGSSCSVCMYTLCVCFPPGDRARIGCAAGLSEVVQSVLGTFYVHSECGLFQGQIHISSFGS